MPNQTTTQKEAPPELDNHLILAAQRGDPSALAAIYDAYARRLYGYFYSRVENAAEAEDLSAQAFMTVIEALPRYQHRGQLSAWIFQIARSKAMDYFRRDHIRAKQEPRQSDIVFDDPLDTIIKDQAIESLRRHIQRLEEEERELLRLRFVGELSYVEIAALLRRKEDTVRKSVNRILERLYAQMEARNV